MSMSALLTATRDFLRAQLSLDYRYIGIQSTAQPPPFMGEKYYSIYPRSIDPSSIGEIMSGIGQSFSFGIAISVKTNFSPRDRQGDEIYVKAMSGIETLAERVIAQVHQSTEILVAANTIIGTDGGQFCEWVRWRGTSLPIEVDATWFWSDPEKQNAPVGMYVDITFGDAVRYIARPSQPAMI